MSAYAARLTGRPYEIRIRRRSHGHVRRYDRELTGDPSFDEIFGDADVCACDMKTTLFDIVQARAVVGTATGSPFRLKPW